jgi:Ca2+-binding EF-hand superfamily protein
MKTKPILLMIATFSLLSAAICRGDESKDHICFRTLDANEDGIVTFQEFEPHYGNDKKTFNTADVDKDNVLTHDEYHQYLGHGSSTQK